VKSMASRLLGGGAMRLASLVFPLVCGASACGGLPADEDPADESESAVEAKALARHFAVANDLTGATRDAQRATGAIFVPIRLADGTVETATDGTPIRATCGVTFIDRTHAITAAHCVEKEEPARSFTVEFYEVDAGVDFKGAEIRGLFPGYVPEKVANGYRITRTSCKVKSRCGFGSYACPFAGGGSESDVALLKCDPLPSDRAPVDLATRDDRRGAVTMFWFHEIYKRPRGSNARDFVSHYLDYRDGMKSNFHYFGNDKNQLFPLVSVGWTDGTPRKRVPSSYRNDHVVWTDLYGCHGTSGSGVMQLNPTTGRFELLGPAALGSWSGLCAPEELPLSSRGTAVLAYSRLEETRALAALIDRPQP
jgi:hypothetical protein